VTGKHLKSNVVSSKHVKNDALQGRDIDESTLELPPGTVCPPGPAGPPGEPATMFAVVDNEHTQVVRGEGVVGFDEGAPDNGRVDVTFDRGLDLCAYVVSTGDVGPAGTGVPASGARVEELLDGNTLRIVTFDPMTGAAAEHPFHVAVVCSDPAGEAANSRDLPADGRYEPA
jgi:hypothetical protein